MYLACIDCGTTNSRVYILDDEYRVVGKGLRKVGVRDTVINGSQGTKGGIEGGLGGHGLDGPVVRYRP